MFHNLYSSVLQKISHGTTKIVLRIKGDLRYLGSPPLHAISNLLGLTHAIRNFNVHEIFDMDSQTAARTFKSLGVTNNITVLSQQIYVCCSFDFPSDSEIRSEGE